MKMKLLTTLLFMTVILCAGCSANGSPDAAPPQDMQNTEAGTEEQEAATEEEKENIPDDGKAEQETEAETDGNEIAETVQFTVDITDNLIGENGMVIGNTSSADKYCGIIEIYLDDPLIEKAETDIQVGHTYLFTAAPMMTMSIPPQITALAYEEASADDIAALEEIRAQISNFEECMAAYETMTLEEIIQDGNFNYALWTQDEIRQYTEFLTQKGYTEDTSPKSYAKIREELGGSVPGGTVENRTQ